MDVVKPHLYLLNLLFCASVHFSSHEVKSLPLPLVKPSRSEGMGHFPKRALGKLTKLDNVGMVESVIQPVAVDMTWYEYDLLLSAAAQVRKFYYLRMRSSKMTIKTGPAKTGPARPLATAM